MNFKNFVYNSRKIQIHAIFQYKITQIFTKKYYLLSKFSKLHNLESQFLELLRPNSTTSKNQKKSFKLSHFQAKLSMKIDVPKCFEMTVSMYLLLIHTASVLSQHFCKEVVINGIYFREKLRKRCDFS